MRYSKVMKRLPKASAWAGSSLRCTVLGRAVRAWGYTIPRQLNPIQRTLHRHGVSQRSLFSTNPPKASPQGEIECEIKPIPSTPGSTTATTTGTVATITINNAARLNSLNSTLISQLTSTLQTLASPTHHPTLRVAIIKGSHPANSPKTPAFTSGADIYEMSALKDASAARAFIGNLATLCETFRTLPCLTVAQIHGLCLGGGLELAACADFRYATAASSFSMPETKYGIPSVIHARLLPDLIGWQRAREMVYLARFYGAREMCDWGLVDTLCADEEELQAQVDVFVREVARHGVRTMRVQKELVRVWGEVDLKTGIESGVESFASMFNHGAEEPRLYMKEFTERKKLKETGEKGS